MEEEENTIFNGLTSEKKFRNHSVSERSMKEMDAQR